jgi:lactate permease
VWSPSYLLLGQGLAISAMIAAVPIFTLLFLLGVLRKPSWMAGLTALAIALVLAIAGYGMPVGMSLSAATYGVAFGLFPISWIVFWAIVPYRVKLETAKFEIIKDSIG